MHPVAAPRDPANEVVPVGGRERQDLDELDALLARQRHQHEVRLHRLRGLLALSGHADFARHAPEILAVVKGAGIGHVVQPVDGGLELEEQLGIPHVLAHLRGHGGRVPEQAGKEPAIRHDDRILIVDHVERRGPIVRVDDHLHAVAHVVDLLAPHSEVPRVRIALRRGEAVHHPRQPAIVADDDVRIAVEDEERGECLDALADVAAHQQPAARGDVVAEGQLAQVAAVERDDQPAEEPAELDAARALVGREAVGFTLRVVELLLARLHVDVRVGQLAEIELRPRHLDRWDRALRRHVAQDERRQPFRREAVDRVHRHTVAVGVDELFVDPVAAALRQLVDVELARREHHLPDRSVHLVAVDVDVGEVVVGADLLDLPQRVLQRAPVPQPDVLQRRLIVWGVQCLEAALGRERPLLDAAQPVGLPRHLDIVRDERRLPHELVRLHDEARHVPAEDRDDRVTRRRGRGGQDQPAGSRRRDRVDERDQRSERQRARHDEEAGERDVRVGVGDAGEDRVVLEQAVESPEVDADGQHRQHEREGDR